MRETWFEFMDRAKRNGMSPTMQESCDKDYKMSKDVQVQRDFLGEVGDVKRGFLTLERMWGLHESIGFLSPEKGYLQSVTEIRDSRGKVIPESGEIIKAMHNAEASYLLMMDKLRAITEKEVQRNDEVSSTCNPPETKS